MGSLMAGWDSPIIDRKTVLNERNLSLTKGEIEAYWKAKKKAEEEHLGFITSPSDSIQDNTFGETVKTFERSNSAPLANRPNTKEVFIHQETETGLEKLIKKNGWWTRSNWAFLNEPPTSEGASNTYTSQFHVASLDTLKSNASEETS